jgi:hypothetical protein
MRVRIDQAGHQHVTRTLVYDIGSVRFPQPGILHDCNDPAVVNGDRDVCDSRHVRAREQCPGGSDDQIDGLGHEVSRICVLRSKLYGARGSHGRLIPNYRAAGCDRISGQRTAPKLPW